jgi:hypothetical protein
MTGPRSLLGASSVLVLALALTACAYFQSEPMGPRPHYSQDQPASAAPPVAAIPATISADELVGRWGLASYHKPEDRARTEQAARNQCRQPYVISKGPTGGVMMHLADAPEPTELRLKGAPGGRNYIGPDGPAGDKQDREIVAFEGRVMLLRWVDPEVAGRYGTMVYVRCGPAGTGPKVASKPQKRKRAPGPEPEPEEAPPSR